MPKFILNELKLKRVLEKEWKAEMLDLGISDHKFITIKAMSDRQIKMKNLIFEKSFLKQKNEIRACIKKP